MASLGQACARARRWISLRLDGELSELEGALLDAHLAFCVDCRSFADTARATAEALRAGRLPETPRTARS
jgi:predicted anti-sigma-YlaC factor YlaD